MIAQAVLFSFGCSGSGSGQNISETTYHAAAWTPLGSLIYYKYVRVDRPDVNPLGNPTRIEGKVATTPFPPSGERQFTRATVVDPLEVRASWSKAINQVAIGTSITGPWSLYTAEGQLIKTLSTGSDIEHLSWSPDGTQFVYDRVAHSVLGITTPGSEDEGLWVTTPDNVTPGTKIPSTGSGDRNPNWSPSTQSTQIVFNCKSDACLINTDGTGRHLLVSNGAEADWSPNGSQLIYIEVEGTQRRIATINADGTNPQRIRAALTSAEQPGGDTYWVGSGPAKIVFRQPHWSPDGTRIVVSGGSVWVMNTDGSSFQAALPHTRVFVPE